MLWVRDAVIGRDADIYDVPPEEAARTALLDALTDNRDRHGSNWLVKDDNGENRIVLIDNEWSGRWGATTFRPLNRSVANTADVDPDYDLPLAESFRDTLYYVYSSGKLEDLAEEYLTPQEWYKMAVRVEDLLQNWPLIFREP